MKSTPELGPDSVRVTVSATLIESTFRHHSSEIIARLTALLGFHHLDLIEDVVQDALEKALRSWPFRGIPDNPTAWLTTVARNAALDRLRKQQNWQGKMPQVDAHLRLWQEQSERNVRYPNELSDDQLRLIFACCHPALTQSSQLALTLRLVASLSTTEIAKALLISQSTVAQRIVRAKRKLIEQGVVLELPAADALQPRLDAALHVIYLMFTEGHTSSCGSRLINLDLCRESIRLLRLLVQHPLGDQAQVHALLALCLLHAARLPSRVDSAQALVLLDDQDRCQWDQHLISEGIRALRASARGDTLSRYHLEAEIAACHATSRHFKHTDWQTIVSCYDHLMAFGPSLVLVVNRSVALAQLHGPAAAWQALSKWSSEAEAAGFGPYYVVAASLLEQLEDADAAEQHLNRARSLVNNKITKQYLIDEATRLHALTSAVVAGET